MSSDDNSDDHDSNYNSDDYYRPRARSPSIEIDWPPAPTGCDLCPFTKFTSPESVRQHITQKVHRKCDQCDEPLWLREDYYCASPEDGMPRKQYFQGVPNRHVACKPVHCEWGKQRGDAIQSLIPAALVVIESSLASGGVNNRGSEDVGFIGFAAQGETTRSDEFLCWVCHQVCVSQLALHSHFERTGHGLCPHYLARRRQEEEDDDDDDDEGDTVMFGSWSSYQRKRKRHPRSPPPLRQVPPRDRHEIRQSAHDHCPNEIRYFDNWFHLEAHLRNDHHNSSTKLTIPDNWEQPKLPSQDWPKQMAADKSIIPIRRRGNSYSPALPKQHLEELRRLCYGSGETKGIVYPFVHRFWDPSLVERGFEPTPLLREERREPTFHWSDWVTPVIRKAVVLSTLTVEMASSRTWYEDQPVHMTLIDFYTGETLITSVIYPKADSVADWRVEETGLHPKMVERASWNYTYCLHGWAEARDRMWDYINKDTIIVGYDIERDLGALRMAHALVVDLKVVVAEWLGMGAEDNEPPRHNSSTTGAFVNIELENLTKSLLGLRIRGANKFKKTFRDTLEEVLAIRETAMWCLENRGLVKNWGMAEKHGYTSQSR